MSHASRRRRSAALPSFNTVQDYLEQSAYTHALAGRLEGRPVDYRTSLLERACRQHGTTLAQLQLECGPLPIDANHEALATVFTMALGY